MVVVWLLALLAAVVAAVTHVRRQHTLETRNAIKALVENGYTVERNGVHIYYSKQAKRLVVLQFNSGSRIDLDEEFDDVEKAIDRHEELAGPARAV